MCTRRSLPGKHAEKIRRVLHSDAQKRNMVHCPATAPPACVQALSTTATDAHLCAFLCFAMRFQIVWPPHRLSQIVYWLHGTRHEKAELLGGVGGRALEAGWPSVRYFAACVLTLGDLVV